MLPILLCCISNGKYILTTILSSSDDAMWQCSFRYPVKSHQVPIYCKVMDRKPELLAALAPRTAKEAAERDIGEIPGDHLGAAGQ